MCRHDANDVRTKKRDILTLLKSDITKLHPQQKCALCAVRLNGTSITLRIVSLALERYKNEISRNDEKLCFS